MALRPITVRQLNDYIQRLLLTDPLLANVRVKGETSGVKYHPNGFIYFDLKDDSSTVNCAINTRTVLHLPEDRIADGTELTVNASVYHNIRTGRFSLSVKSVEIEGRGALSDAFEKLKKKLLAEGLFDQEKKKPVPVFPGKVGVITAGTGAAIHDIMKNIRMRNDLVDVVIFPVLVQGQNAPAEIAEAIRLANSEFDDIDVLIVGRGGGSADDLSCFDTEAVARAIYASDIPVISAVGHETDFSISDMVADVRAETPTKAAQLAVPDISSLRESLEAEREAMFRALSDLAAFSEVKLENISSGMRNDIIRKIDSMAHEADSCRLILEQNDPRNIMKNGYAVFTDTKGTVITDISSVDTGADYRVILSDGTVDVRSTGVKNDR